MTGIGQHVVGKADHGLAFEHGLAGGVGVVVGDVFIVLLDVFCLALNFLASPLVEVDFLVLKGVGKLVRHHRLLLLDRHPVEQIHLLGFVVVEAGNLLGEQAQEERPHLEALVEQAKLLEHEFAALHALGALVLVELLAQFGVDGGAGDEPALHRALDLEVGVFADEVQDLVLGGEQGLLLLGREDVVGGDRRAARRDGQGA